MTDRITYLLSNDTEADVRLSDSLLYAALSEALGDILDPQDWARHVPKGEPVWGQDRFHTMVSRTTQLCEAWNDAHVLEVVQAKILPKNAVQAEMDRLGASGFGAVLRNMRNPEIYMRYCARGDRFSQHETHISANLYDTPIIVSPNLDLSFVRRFLIVAGEIAAETPYQHCEGRPLDLLLPDAWRLQAESFMSPLTQEDWVRRDMQKQEADRLLSGYPMASGAIDVGLRITADGEVTAHVDNVVNAPPGAFATFYADVRTYAKAIAENMHVLEPRLTVAAASVEP